MLELLRSLEWANVGPCCPSCERVKMDGHTPDCRLDRAIREMAEHPLRGFLLHEVRDGVAEYRGCVATSGMPAPVGTIAFTEHSPPEPTVDEMAREMGLTRGIYRNWTTNSDADLVQLETDGQWVWRPNGTLRDRDLRSWPTDTDAIRSLYREHKARQADPPAATVDDFGGVHCPACHCVFGEVRIRNGKQAICPNCGRRVRMKEEPPTDPSALAAWLYARVVPGRTVVEWEAPSVDRVRRCKSLVVNVEIDGDHIVVWPNDSALYIPPPSKHVTRATRLLNPDGTVLWEAK